MDLLKVNALIDQLVSAAKLSGRTYDTAEESLASMQHVKDLETELQVLLTAPETGPTGIQVGHVDGQVRILFDHPVTWIDVDPKVAMNLSKVVALNAQAANRHNSRIIVPGQRH